LAEGIDAPAFSVTLDNGTQISLGDFTGQRLVIFFYPRAGTPGCTEEAADFSRRTPNFAALNTAVLGVSADPARVLQRFREKHLLTIQLGSDEAHAMLSTYGVWDQKSMYGKLFMGVLRTTFLIATDGRIARIWRKVKVKGHADDVLAALKT
jgi:peroxiredoxin Q/BCP